MTDCEEELSDAQLDVCLKLLQPEGSARSAESEGYEGSADSAGYADSAEAEVLMVLKFLHDLPNQKLLQDQQLLQEPSDKKAAQPEPLGLRLPLMTSFADVRLSSASNMYLASSS